GCCFGRFGLSCQVRLLRPLTLGISVLTQTGSALQEGQSAIPGQSRRLRVVCLGAIRLDKPMSRASITMERDAAVRTLQSLFQFADVCFRFELVVLGGVAEIRCLRVVECSDAGAV